MAQRIIYDKHDLEGTMTTNPLTGQFVVFRRSNLHFGAAGDHGIHHMIHPRRDESVDGPWGAGDLPASIWGGEVYDYADLSKLLKLEKFTRYQEDIVTNEYAMRETTIKDVKFCNTTTGLSVLFIMVAARTDGLEPNNCVLIVDTADFCLMDVCVVGRSHGTFEVAPLEETAFFMKQLDVEGEGEGEGENSLIKWHLPPGNNAVWEVDAGFRVNGPKLSPLWPEIPDGRIFLRVDESKTVLNVQHTNVSFGPADTHSMLVLLSDQSQFLEGAHSIALNPQRTECAAFFVLENAIGVYNYLTKERLNKFSLPSTRTTHIRKMPVVYQPNGKNILFLTTRGIWLLNAASKKLVCIRFNTKVSSNGTELDYPIVNSVDDAVISFRQWSVFATNEKDVTLPEWSDRTHRAIGKITDKVLLLMMIKKRIGDDEDGKLGLRKLPMEIWLLIMLMLYHAQPEHQRRSDETHLMKIEN